MINRDFLKLSNATREIIKNAKLGDALYTIREIDGSICDCCSQIKKELAIIKVYVGKIEEEIDGGRRLTLYRETPMRMKTTRYGMSEFYPIGSAFYGTGDYLALHKEDLLSELEYKMQSDKEMNEFRVREDSKE